MRVVFIPSVLGYIVDKKASRSFCDTSTEAANIYLVKYFVGNLSVMILSITTPNGRLKFEVSSNDIVDIF